MFMLKDNLITATIIILYEKEISHATQKKVSLPQHNVLIKQLMLILLLVM